MSILRRILEGKITRSHIKATRDTGAWNLSLWTNDADDDDDDVLGTLSKRKGYFCGQCSVV